MRRIARGSRIHRAIGRWFRSTPGPPRLRQQVVWRIEKAARQYPAASRAQNRLVSKSPVRPGCGRFALASDRGESKLLFRSKEQIRRCEFGHTTADFMQSQTGTSELVYCRRTLIDRFQTALLLGAKRSFRMGVAGWRFAQRKRISGRAAVVAVLEELPVICSLTVAAVSMTMIGIMLYKDWPQ